MALHALDELEEFDKTIDFICEILEKGEHKLESKGEQKMIAKLKVGKMIWETAYRITGNTCTIIHFGVKRV